MSKSHQLIDYFPSKLIDLIGRYKSRSLVRWVLPIGILTLFTSAGCEQVEQYLPPLPQLDELPLGDRSWIPRPVQSATASEMEVSVRDRINTIRQEHGLTALANNDRLAEVARQYSQLMAKNNTFSHTGPDGSTLAERVQAGGIVYWVVGENLFKSTNVAQPVPLAIDGWMKSPGHRENILRPIFRETGVGVWKVGNTYYITQLFLRR